MKRCIYLAFNELKYRYGFPLSVRFYGDINIVVIIRYNYYDRYEFHCSLKSLIIT